MHNLDTCGGAGCARENDVSNAWSAQPHMITAEFIASDYIRTWRKTYEYCRKNIWITEKKWIVKKTYEKNMNRRKKHMDCRKKHMYCRIKHYIKFLSEASAECCIERRNTAAELHQAN